MTIKVIRGNPTPEELAADRLPQPGPTTWSRTYWPG